MEHVEERIESNDVALPDMEIEDDCDAEESIDQKFKDSTEDNEIALAAESIALNPRLFAVMIDTVNLLGLRAA